MNLTIQSQIRIYYRDTERGPPSFFLFVGFLFFWLDKYPSPLILAHCDQQYSLDKVFYSYKSLDTPTADAYSWKTVLYHHLDIDARVGHTKV